MPSHSTLLHLLSSQSVSLAELPLLMFFNDRGTLSFRRKEGAMIANLMECEVLNCSCIEHTCIDIFPRLLSDSEKHFMFSCLVYWLDLWVCKCTAFLHSNLQICSASSHSGWHQVADQEPWKDYSLCWGREVANINFGDALIL